jgi:hypothetical protein
MAHKAVSSAQLAHGNSLNIAKTAFDRQKWHFTARRPKGSTNQFHDLAAAKRRRAGIPDTQLETAATDSNFATCWGPSPMLFTMIR